MESYKKIAVIGGTGKSGKYLVQQLLHHRLPFSMLVRNADDRPPEDFPNQSALVKIVKGDVKDYETVSALIKGCDAVISTLGLGQPPSETSIFSQATKNLLRAMQAQNIQRYILITGLNVDTPFDKKGPRTQGATDWMYANFPASTTDKQLEYDLLSVSKVDWTIVRLPMIEQTDASGEISISLEDCLGEHISATDLARFLIRQLSDDTYLRKAPFIANV